LQDDRDAQNELTLDHAIALHRAGRLNEAQAIYQRILSANPDDAGALQLLGAIAHQTGRHGEAVALIQRSLAMAPSGKQALNNLGEALRATGQVEASVAAFRQALHVDPGYVKARSNLLMTLHFLPDMDGPTLRREHEQWALAHAARFDPRQPQAAVQAAPDRPIRIGYISPDLRRHSVGYFIEPILEHHDRERFPAYCYSSDPRGGDDVTERLRRHAFAWRDIAQLNDDDAAAMIRADGIDILVDLAGHMAKNRLLVLARRPAPIQATYLGYPNGTGMSQVDFRITDAISDEGTDDHYVEKLVKLPNAAGCYRPPENSPAVVDAPAICNGFVTFGSFNKFPKVSPPLLKLWAQILAAAPNSKLLIKAKSLGDPSTQAVARRMFDAAGTAPDRVSFTGWTDDPAGHLATYGQVDVALDTFPYHGTTTTCEAMWMGVPVVTLAGATHVSRVGVSLLSAVGLRDLVATSSQQYVDTAVALANDQSRIIELRATLRDRMRASPLMDAVTFARNLESAYRQMIFRD
jgi:predicted O-linked N-acetylglucosamine transferase (SPINDLY family)